MLQYCRINKNYGTGQSALNDINIWVKKNGFVILTGPSGAGKSTILKLAFGMIRPSSGQIYFNGENITQIKPKNYAKIRQKIGFVFQDFKLLSSKTAYENVAFAMEMNGKPQSEIEEIVPQVLDMVGLADKLRNMPHQMSGAVIIDLWDFLQDDGTIRRDLKAGGLI